MYAYLVILLVMKFHIVKNSQLVMKSCTGEIGGITSVGAPVINQAIGNPLESLGRLQSFIPNPKNICQIILSHGNIGHLPSGRFVNFSNLIELSLNNNISTISTMALIGLTGLKRLNLSGNPIQEWNTSRIFKETPQLAMLEMTSTSPWKPGNTLLSLRHLQRIEGISWSRHCLMCSIFKSFNKTQLSQYANDSSKYLEGYACRLEVISPSTFVRNLAKYGFLATCLLDNQSLCFKSEFRMAVKAPCKQSTLSVMYAQFFLGPLAILLNLIVIGTVFTSKRLRQNHDMILVTNIAIGDLCNGIYSIVIVSIHSTQTFEELDEMAQKYCPYIGCFWVIGIGIVFTSSLVLTIERYKGIVRTKNRLKRMSANGVLLGLFVSWSIGIIAAILPAFGIGQYSLNTYCIPVFPVKSMPVQYYYSITLAGLAATFYIITIPLYLKMYLFVRKSMKKMRVRADIELAKRVFTLVITNMLFFLVPVILSLVFANVNRNTDALSREVSEILNSSLPLVCLTLNSVLNPTLYAFRYRNFKREMSTMRSRASRLSSWSSSGAISRNPYVFSNRAQSRASLSSAI